MRARTVGILAGLIALVCAAGAQAAAPIMPLRDVRAGMQCTGYSVFRGQAIEPFNVEIIDVVGQAANAQTQPRLLVRVSGEKVDATGVGPGFSGSPIFCPAVDGRMLNAGAISETIGDYGGKTVLATPIEQILATPVKAPRAPKPAPPGKARRDAALLARAKPLLSPLTVGGLAPSLMRKLTAAGKRRGVTVLAAPSVPADSSPVKPFEPGSAVAAGYSSGDLSVSAIGTVAYVDGRRVWAFGHSFDSAGARALLLQDAYVATIVNNPLQVEDIATYKLSGPVHDVGRLTNDGFDAVAGRVGKLPPTTSVKVRAKDLDRGVAHTTSVNVADEYRVGNPLGFSLLGYVGPLAVSQGATDVLGAAPQRLAGNMCLRVSLRGRKRPLGFCNRYVNDGIGFGDTIGENPVALSASDDSYTALGLFDGYKGKPVHVTDARARVTMTRGQHQAYLRSVKLPRRVRRGASVPVKLVIKVVRGERKTIRFRWKVPRGLKTGKRTLRVHGTDPDSEGGGFFDSFIIDFSGGREPVDTEGPRSVAALRKLFGKQHRYDGIKVGRGLRFYRDGTYRIGGFVKKKVTVLPGRRSRRGRG